MHMQQAADWPCRYVKLKEAERIDNNHALRSAHDCHLHCRTVNRQPLDPHDGPRRNQSTFMDQGDSCKSRLRRDILGLLPIGAAQRLR